MQETEVRFYFTWSGEGEAGRHLEEINWFPVHGVKIRCSCLKSLQPFLKGSIWRQNEKNLKGDDSHFDVCIWISKWAAALCLLPSISCIFILLLQGSPGSICLTLKINTHQSPDIYSNLTFPHFYFKGTVRTIWTCANCHDYTTCNKLTICFEKWIDIRCSF